MENISGEFLLKSRLLKTAVIIMTVMISFVCVSCSKKQDEKVMDIEFTVCDDSRVPDKLLEQIEKRKTNKFGISYNDGDNLYIAKGYGRQETGGYSIRVTDLYTTAESVVVKTELIGPGEKDLVLRGASYPYVVVMTENIDLPVDFE